MEDAKIRTIAIVLCDNDFVNTFEPLLESIKLALKHQKGMGFGEKDVEAWIRAGIPYFYRTFQWHGTGALSEEDQEKSIKYLSQIKVLFNEKAEQHIEEHDHDGGSWYLDVPWGIVHSY
jgi:hypothetical protein